MRNRALSVILGALVASPVSVAIQRKDRPEPPAPDYADIRYGPHERNLLDIWLTRSDRPTPLVIYYHGGGFRQGDKRTINLQLLRQLRESGITVAAANYRLSSTAPYPAQMHDCAHALQFLRAHAAEYRIDPARIGAMGGSAGAGISQWLAFHDDLADANSPDPILRQSTRLTAIVVYNAQSSYDPRFIKKLMETDQVDAALIAFFGMNSAADVDKPEFHPLFEDASPINHLTVGDPPILVFYSQRDDPLPVNSPGNVHIHHPRFGHALKAKADEVGVECTVLFREQYPDGQPIAEFVEFFLQKLGT